MSKIKNDVIEKQYEELKNGIKFRIENNITNDWEQLYHCIDVLCEKHKERIKDIENGICVIEKLEAKLAESESRFQAHKQNDARIIQDQTDLIENLKQQVKEKEKQLSEYSDINNALNSGLQDRCISCEEEHNQDKISFAVEALEIAQKYVQQYVNNFDDMNDCLCAIDNQIKAIKGEK